MKFQESFYSLRPTAWFRNPIFISSGISRNFLYTYRMTSNSQPKRWSVFSTLAMGVMAASTGAIFIRLAQSGGIPSLVIAAARLSIASLILAPIILIKHLSDLKLIGYKYLFLTFLAGIFLAFHFAFWITSLEYTSITSSVVLVSTTPIWVVLITGLAREEHISYLFLAGLFFSILGTVLIGFSDSCSWNSGILACQKILNIRGAFLGDILSLMGAWAAAGYLLLGKKVRKTMPLLLYIFLVYGFAAILLVIACVLSSLPIFGFPVQSYLWLLLLAIIPQLIGHSVFNWSLQYLPASFVSLSLLGEPIGSTILAIFIFGEIPVWSKFIGLLFLLVGIWISGRNLSG